MLAAASLGAVWSSCSPDFGANGVLDRFGQIEPRGARSAPTATATPARRSTRSRRVREVRASGFRRSSDVVVVPYRRSGARRPRRTSRRRAVGRLRRRCTADRPTRLRAAAVRSSALHHVLLGHDRAAQVHGARRRRDAAPAPEGAGAAHRPRPRRPDLLLHHLRLDDVELAGVEPRGRRDGRALRRRAARARRPILWDMAAAGADHACSAPARSTSRWREKEGLAPGRTHDLVGAARDPLDREPACAAHSFDYVYRRIKRDVHLASISGGTDIISCFALGNPTGPVWRGELQTAASGWRSTCSTTRAAGARGRDGELVCTRHSPACRSRSGTIPTAPSTAPRTSSISPACGATATGPSSPSTTA